MPLRNLSPVMSKPLLALEPHPMIPSVPQSRLRVVNDRELRPDGDFVLYWMIANRRTRYNFALQRAVTEAERLGKPLVVLEALRVGYRWASDRHHRFILQGMAENRRRLQAAGVTCWSYVEPSPGAGRGLLAALAARACLVVTDAWPCFFLPRMVTSAGRALTVRLEEVDSVGLLPIRDPGRDFTAAVHFRRHLHKRLPTHLLELPEAEPLSLLSPRPAPTLPAELPPRWPDTDETALLDLSRLAALPIDHNVKPVPHKPGGSAAGERRLHAFVAERLSRYNEDRNQPSLDGGSGLSPYLHYGHVSPHEALRLIIDAEGWTPARLGPKPTASKDGWWGMSQAAEAFIDELVTWRELGFNFAFEHPTDYDRYERLPDWARATLEKHTDDRRERVYSLTQLAESKTHDPLWNAAQRQLVREGVIHNYLRMLWGKKILEWSATPQDALDALVELNNRYALDGRDPSSYSGIFWTLGRFDRPWGPERPIFGSVRYMSSDSTAKKLDVKGYLARFGG